MFTKKDKLHKQGIKKMDALVTGLLLWWVVASIYGIKKATQYKAIEEGQIIDPRQEESKRRAKKILKMLIFGCESAEVQEEKKGFFRKLFKK